MKNLERCLMCGDPLPPLKWYQRGLLGFLFFPVLPAHDPYGPQGKTCRQKFFTRLCESLPPELTVQKCPLCPPGAEFTIPNPAGPGDILHMEDHRREAHGIPRTRGVYE